MTPAKFYAARLAQAFGIHRKTKRMSEAASEMHLLRDAEMCLGGLVWERVGEIEELSVEYWKLRKLSTERKDILERLTECDEQLAIAHAARANLLNKPSDAQQALLEERARKMEHLEKLARQRDEIVAKAKELRRSHEGLKMKLEVLGRERQPHPTETAEAQAKLDALKAKFGELKEQRARLGETLDAGDADLDECDAKLAKIHQERREEAAEAFQVIGEANRVISVHRAELGLIETQMSQLYSEIGRFVSRNMKNPACIQAAREHRGMVEVMQALRASIVMNHRLAGQS